MLMVKKDPSLSPVMTDDHWFFNKDIFFIKTTKKSPLVLRMVLLVFSMICGGYIFSICLKQTNTHAKPNYILPKFRQMHGSCNVPRIQQGENLHLHYPVPKSYSRGECICTPVRFFAILSMQRSGSGWFETLLNSHVNVSSNGEIFSVKERRSDIISILMTLDKVYNLDWSSSAAKNECSAAVGFKWMLNQGAMEYPKEIVKYFKRRGVSAIFLFRKNLLCRLVSLLANNYDRDAKLLNGTHKSHVHSEFEAEVLAQYKPTINVESLLSDLKHMEKMTADALDFFKTTRHIILYYEDLVNDRRKLVDVQEFLQVPQRKLESRQVKIHTRPLSEQVENWDDVLKTLKGTQYESFLELSSENHHPIYPRTARMFL